MLANDMKKGTWGYLKNGWKFEIADNKKGIIRLAKVWGFETELGSIYVKDIGSVYVGNGGYEQIKFSPAQAKQLQAVARAGF